MLNRSREEAVSFIKANAKAYNKQNTMTNKQVGAELGVSGPRVSQMISEIKSKEANDTQEPQAA